MATVPIRAVQKERGGGWEDVLTCPLRSLEQIRHPQAVSLPPVGNASIGEQLWPWTWAVGTERPRPWRLWVPSLMSSESRG